MSEPPAPPTVPANQDAEHLRLLTVFHYVVGGLTALFACFPFIHLGIGVFMLLKPEAFKPRPPPEFLAWIFVVFAAGMILAGWTLALLFVLAGRNLSRRRRYLFCQVVAGVGCIFMPFGTVLGVFTLLVLARPSVRELFQK
ncbi:MAG: hypothetical protein FD161_1561 [Limisphaerales bacterium]|nr:MAG: hypothetical protein FD161_1561 [Limisphaerales bacterium]KAG0509375.1 MAG: hypothetical protein E1N63_1480 [Limisphaerales bacterium]TXT52120.1 MAG: hypothetical protein FD140_1053 [Limisphaerales bacterium]